MRLAIRAALAVAVALSVVAPANAGFRQRPSYEPGEVIVARSHFGNGVVKGVVRAGRTGWEVRLPRGSWVGCRTSCEETLRVETVDLTENDDGSLAGYGTLSRECGIFGCIRLGF